MGLVKWVLKKLGFVKKPSVEDRLHSAGTFLVSKVEENFVTSGNGRWPSRGVPNIAGIIKDVNAGKNPPSRRWDPGPVLVDTGMLRKSFRYEVVGKKVRVVSDVPYASEAMEGGKREIIFEPAFKRNLWAMMKKNKKLKKMGFLWGLQKKGPYMIDVPKRDFDLENEDTMLTLNDILRGNG